MTSIIFHIDVNSAFLSWSAIHKLQNGDDIDLRLIPSIIGGDMERRHGVVLAKSVPAKRFGIQTGEPIVAAMRKCPSLTIAPPNHALYGERSGELFAFLHDICPDIEQISIDECYMNFSPISAKYSSPLDAAVSIKDEIFQKFGFTVNIGISDRKILAKMASDFQKPNLVHTLFRTEISEKMWPLPVASLYMCGRSSAETLHKLGITTIGELAKADPEILTSHLKSHGVLLWNYANGIDDSAVCPTPAELKGIGNSTTLSKDAESYEVVKKVLLYLAESVGARLRESGRLAGMVSTEVKYNTFQSVSHQKTLSAPTNSTDLIYQTACELFLELWNQTPIRLLGIRTSKLVTQDTPQQLSLFDLTVDTRQSNKKEQLDKAVDDIRRKFGSSAIVRGSLLGHPDEFKK